MKVGILGLGLIGASISLKLKEERKEVIKVFNQMGQETSIESKGVLIYLWDNGEVTKTINRE